MSYADIEPKASVTLIRRNVPVIGEREARLLEAIERVRSIKDAAVEAGISYRTAWSAIQQIERTLGRSPVVSRAGGPGGGATSLTDECRRLLSVYQELQRRLENMLNGFWTTAMGEPATGTTG